MHVILPDFTSLVVLACLLIFLFSQAYLAYGVPTSEMKFLSLIQKVDIAFCLT